MKSNEIGYNNHRIQKFDSTGVYQIQFGSNGSGNGQFKYPEGMAIDSSGNIFVVDRDNNRIQKFDTMGNYINQFGSYVADKGQFRSVGDIAIDTSGNIFVADNGNRRIQKFNSSGVYQSQFGSFGSESGQFINPSGIAMDNSGNIFAADAWGNRIQKFNSFGVYQSQFGSNGTGNGQFNFPFGIAIDISGNIFVADTSNHRIQKFNSAGVYQGQFGSKGTGNGQFDFPYGVAVDTSDNIFVVDSGNNRIQKFNSAGIYQSQFGSLGSGNGQFDFPHGIALDGSGNIFVDDTYNNRIQKFNSAGVYQSQFGSLGSGNGQFYSPYGVAVDSLGNVFVADTNNNRIQKWAPVASQFTISGYVRDSSNKPGIGVTLTFSNSGGTAITDSSGFYSKTVSSDWNGTVTLSKGSYTFIPSSRSYSNITSALPDQNYTYIASNKAIIVAGGYYSTNDIWDATRINTEIAYNALESQGYAPENIYYLSSDKNFISPADGFASKKNFQDAIESWASDADNLLIYMISHGGTGTFKINETETLYAWELDGWLDNIQQKIPGNVILIYDACMSGSFIEYLIPPTGKKRIIVTSASAAENAIIAQEGIFTFSWFFWPQISVGRPFYDSFINTRNAIEVLRDSLITRQHPQIDADGNGKGNEDADIEIAINTKLPRETYGFPDIGSVSPNQTLADKTSALIYAENVTDADGIKRVWAAVIRAEAVSCYSADTPITYLPIIELKSVGNNRYETTYTGFTSKGIYKFAVFATDNRGFTSLLEQKQITYVTQTQDFSAFARKGDLNGDSQTNLADVILALQVLSGLKPSQSRCDYASSGADVNGDSRVGLEESIYILQVIVGLR